MREVLTTYPHMLLIRPSADNTILRHSLDITIYRTYMDGFERYVANKGLVGRMVSTVLFEDTAALFDAEYLLGLPFWMACVFPGSVEYRVALLRRYYTRKDDE
jgi:hypothetical protein